MTVTADIKYIGVNDHTLDLFEGMYPVPKGMAYNSYVIIDEKIAVMDTVDATFTEQWFANMQKVLGSRKPDYLIVQHMEPDHSANILYFSQRYPEATIVSSGKAFEMMRDFFGTDFADRRIAVADGDKLALGRHMLTFVSAFMVHWPEVIMTYDSTEKVLFSADAFGKFGALDEEEDWVCEARRYYFGIVGKYGAQVQKVLKKLNSLEITKICSLHGPILSENIAYYLKMYHIWSSYVPEEEGVVIAYTSIYGNTKKAVMLLAEQLKASGMKTVVLHDLARCDMTEAVEDAFRYSKLVLATTTYNAELFPFMRTFISYLTGRNYSNRVVALIENGSWAPIAARLMRECFSKSKDLVFTDTTVTIRATLREDSLAQLKKLAEELCAADLTENQSEEKR